MTAHAKDLTTLATLRSYLNPGSNDDILLQRLITAASSAIQSYLNRSIKSASFSDLFDGTGGSVMMLPEYPITAVSAVTINAIAIPVGNTITKGYYFSKDKVVLNGYTFTRGNSNVSISWTGGYSEIPFEIEQACISTIQFWLGDRQRNGEVSRTMGQQTISYSQKDMPEFVKTVLHQHRRVHIV